MNAMKSQLLGLAIFFCIASSFQLFTSKQSTTSALEQAGTSSQGPVVRQEDTSQQEPKKEHRDTLRSSLVVCEKGCRSCSEENGTLVNCFIEMTTPISVLRVVEETFGFLRVVSRVNIGTDLLELDANPFSPFNLSSIPCPNLIDFTAAPAETMMFCLRPNGTDTDSAPGMPTPLQFDSLPLGFLGSVGGRQVEQLSTPSRVEAIQSDGLTVLLPLIPMPIANLSTLPFPAVSAAGNLGEFSGSAGLVCGARSM